MTIQIPGIQSERIRDAVQEILEALGEDTGRDGIVDTPARVAEMYKELFAGLLQDPSEVLATGFEEGHDEMVIVKDIQFLFDVRASPAAVSTAMRTLGISLAGGWWG